MLKEIIIAVLVLVVLYFAFFGGSISELKDVIGQITQKSPSLSLSKSSAETLCRSQVEKANSILSTKLPSDTSVSILNTKNFDSYEEINDWIKTWSFYLAIDGSHPTVDCNSSAFDGLYVCQDLVELKGQNNTTTPLAFGVAVKVEYLSQSASEVRTYLCDSNGNLLTRSNDVSISNSLR